MNEYTLKEIDPGHEVEYRGKRSRDKRTIRVDRVWHVLKGDVVLGTISYEMITRETRSKGKRYVNSRWRSPGWRYNFTPFAYGGGYRAEATSRKDAMRKIIANYEGISWLDVLG